MAFVKVNKSRVGGVHAEPTIRMGWHKQGGNNEGRAIYFSIARMVADEAGWKLVSQPSKDGSPEGRLATSIAVMEGTGEDAGFLMLVPDDSGYRLGTNKGGVSVNVSLTMGVATNRLNHYVLNDAAIEVEPSDVEYTIDAKDHSILIQCPDWLRYNPLSVREPEQDDKVLEREYEKQQREVKTKEGPPTLRQRAMRATNAVAEEVADVIPLNRRERRRIASTVARTLSK